MSVINRALLLCSLTLPVLAQAAPVPPAAEVECGESSQAQMRECLVRQAQESEKTLRLAEKKARESLMSWDNDRLYRIRAASALMAANRTFVSYRRDSCAFAQSLNGGAAGNDNDLRRLSCEAAMNTRRAAELEQQAAALPAR